VKENRLVPVGKITKPHGVRGALKIFPYGETLAAQRAGDVLFLRPDACLQSSSLTISDIRSQGRVLVVGFEEFSSLEDAKDFVGEEVYLPENRLPPPSEGEYYHYQLIGLEVETRSGLRLGVLRSIIETGGNDVYVVERGGSEVLIPALEDVIIRVDVDRRMMVVELPEGLMDDL